MFDYIEKLRQKSEQHKKRFAFSVASVFCLIISGVWFVSTYPTLKEQSEIDKKVAKIESGPTESFVSNFSTAFKDLKDSVTSLKETVSSIGSDLDYYRASTTLGLVGGANDFGNATTTPVSTTTVIKTEVVEVVPEENVKIPEPQENIPPAENVYGGL